MAKGYDEDLLNRCRRSVRLQRMLLQKLSVASFTALGAKVQLAWRKRGLARNIPNLLKWSGQRVTQRLFLRWIGWQVETSHSEALGVVSIHLVGRLLKMNLGGM